MTKFRLILLLLLPLAAAGQGSDSNYPQGYFRDPLNIPITLAGNFGECRPGHFHSGMDIKTNGVENLPVFAAADGYLSRIKMDKNGFGHALYITHPNGYTSLYAHLNDFMPEIQQYLKQAQYQQEVWAVDINLPPEKFPIHKGQQIAWSGNTGGSTAPHLHFEIRDTKTEHPLNPQQFGFNINDTRPPVPTMIAIYDLNRSIYSQDPELIKLGKQGDTYVTSADTLAVNTNLLGLGVDINDYMNGSDNTLAFYKAEWTIDGKPGGTIILDDIGYDVTRYLNAYADYKTKQQHGRWFQCMFQLPGNRLDVIYKDLNREKGGLALNDGEVHNVAIIFTDDAGNKTKISLKVRAKDVVPHTPPCPERFTANKPNSHDDPNVKLTLKEAALYDDLCFSVNKKPFSKGFSSKFMISAPEVPLHTYFDLLVKPDRPVPFHLRDKLVLMYSDGKDEEGHGAIQDNGWYKASVRAFGDYWLSADTTGPVITPSQKDNAVLTKATSLIFTVKDDLTSVKSFRAELDGKWLCFEPRGNAFIYRFDEHCKAGKHMLSIKAVDETGNIRTLHYNFTR